MKILIFGLPGSGKTTLAQSIKARLDCVWYNADEVRKNCDDWDFSEDGRVRQALRMKELAESNPNDIVVCDFVAPTNYIRKLFNADISIWMNTIDSGRFENTNIIFERPDTVSYVIDHYLTPDEIDKFIGELNDR